MVSVVTGGVRSRWRHSGPAVLQRGDRVPRPAASRRAGPVRTRGSTWRGAMCATHRRLLAAFEGADVVYPSCSSDSHPRPKGQSRRRVSTLPEHRIVVRACLDSHVHRLVHFSSIHALAEAQTGCATDESLPLVETSSCLSYDASKAEGERFVLDALRSGLDAVVVAPTAVVGPYDYRPSYFVQCCCALPRSAPGPGERRV